MSTLKVVLQSYSGSAQSSGSTFEIPALDCAPPARLASSETSQCGFVLLLPYCLDSGRITLEDPRVIYRHFPVTATEPLVCTFKQRGPGIDILFQTKDETSRQ